MSALKRICLMIALACMWSPSFLFIKLATEELPPITVSACRVTIAFLMLGTLLLYLKRTIPLTKTFWMHTSVMAMFSSALPFSLFCIAETSIESAVAAIINGSTPIFTAMLTQIFFREDKMTSQKVCGIVFCFTGLVLLFLPNLNGKIEGSPLCMLAAGGASLSYAISHIYGKKYLTKQPAYIAPAAQFLFSSLYLWPIALVFESPEFIIPSWQAIGAIFGLAILGTFIAFIIYYKLLEESGPTAISTVACFFPVGGVLLGFFFLGETLTSTAIFAAGLIFCGLLFVNEFLSLKFFKERILLWNSSQR